jgi:hypothetical protein
LVGAVGIEPVRSEEALRDTDPDHEGHEGELTAGRRLIDWLHQTYGGFIDAIVGDALYANGPVMTQLTPYGYGGFLVLKKEKDQPFQEALKLWEIEGRRGRTGPVIHQPSSPPYLEEGRTRHKQTGCCTDGLVRSGAFRLARPAPLESSVAGRSGTPGRARQGTAGHGGN